jgi:cyclin-dependent kinase 12/13
MMKNIPKQNYKKTDNFPSATFPGRDPLITWKARDANIYEKVLKVGQGTYGKVYKAKIKSKNNSKDEKVEFVALKKIILEQEKDGFPLTAIREIVILRRLKHKNISNLIEVVVSSPSEKNNKRGNVFLVFEYVEQDLYGLLHSNIIKLSVPQIKQIFHQILCGLLYLKQNSIIHRDLKTSNILLNNKGIVKLADFGLARTHNPRTKNPYTNKVVTLWYRAPEILLGGPYNIASDMWSAGIILAELLTKNCPFQGKIEVEQLQRIYDLCGVPDERTWPEVTQMKNYKLFMPEKIPQNRLKSEIEQISKLDEYGVDLLLKMLELNPNKRISVEEALNHPYFLQEPSMCTEDDLPKVQEDVHELGTRLEMAGEINANKSVEISSKVYSDKNNLHSFDNKNQIYLNKKRIIREDN